MFDINKTYLVKLTLSFEDCWRQCQAHTTLASSAPLCPSRQSWTSLPDLRPSKCPNFGHLAVGFCSRHLGIWLLRWHSRCLELNFKTVKETAQIFQWVVVAFVLLRSWGSNSAFFHPKDKFYSTRLFSQLLSNLDKTFWVGMHPLENSLARSCNWC